MAVPFEMHESESVEAMDKKRMIMDLTQDVFAGRGAFKAGKPKGKEVVPNRMSYAVQRIPFLSANRSSSDQKLMQENKRMMEYHGH